MGSHQEDDRESFHESIIEGIPGFPSFSRGEDSKKARGGIRLGADGAGARQGQRVPELKEAMANGIRSTRSMSS